MRHVLVVDDEEAVCWTLQRALRREGYDVAVASSAEEAFDRAREHCPDAIVLDVRLPGMDGLSALAKLRQLTGDAPVIIVTAHGNLSTAVRAVENGAFEYLAKPFDLDQALAAVERAVQAHALRSRGGPEPVAEVPVGPPEDIVGRSPAMQMVFKRIAMVAPHPSCVLITGESGTGKELVARAIHRYSARRDGPFLPVNVAALNPGLVEGELFGHVKGAFTGAAQTSPGLFALAAGGTVFLDEVGDIPLQVQVKLLRVLEHGEMLPVGGRQPQPLDVRVLAATHQDLNRKVAEGSFRHDLFFRLNVFPIQLPPLRERAEDIVLLAEHFLRRLQPRALPLLPATLAYLAAQPWPGNVRELRNALEHAVIVARDGPLLLEHFPAAGTVRGGRTPAEELDQVVRRWLGERLRAAGDLPPADLYAQLLQCVEPALLDEVLRRVRGNRWAAAQWLGLNRATVRKKLHLYHLDGLEQPPKEEPEEE